MIARTLRPAIAAPALALLLSGCLGSLLGGKPENLYRFGAPEAATTGAQGGPLPAGGRKVQLVIPSFPIEAAGDRILTVEGANASYIKDARWVTAGPFLYRAALANQFAPGGPVVPLTERHRGDADYALRVRIDRFEARYENGPKAPPVVEIDGTATLFDKAGKERASYALADREPAAANRTGEIVAAYDRAVARQTAGLARWLGGQAGRGD